MATKRSGYEIKCASCAELRCSFFMVVVMMVMMMMMMMMIIIIFVIIIQASLKL